MGFDRRAVYDEDRADYRGGGRGNGSHRQRGGERRGWSDSAPSSPSPFMEYGSAPSFLGAPAKTHAFSAEPEPASAEALTGKVKWYSADKRFGFVVFNNGHDDALLRSDVLLGAGRETIAQGVTLVCTVEKGSRGFVINAISSIDDSTAERPPSRPSAPVAPAAGAGGQVNATVKWFDIGKGYGFLAGESGGDIFLHITALKRSGIDDAFEGDAFVVTFETSDRGRVARSVSPL